MSNKKTYFQKAKIRHDFTDQIMVRYTDRSGEEYDCWVSGEEVAQRLKTTQREEEIKALIQLDIEKLRHTGQQLIDTEKDKSKKRLWGKFADTVSDAVGGNIIGDELVNKIRDQGGIPLSTAEREKEKWQQQLTDPVFRYQLLELAWIQIGDTIPPEEKEDSDFDDWV